MPLFIALARHLPILQLPPLLRAISRADNRRNPPILIDHNNRSTYNLIFTNLKNKLPMKINRFITNICSGNLQESKQFYARLFELKVNYESDWFIHLVAEGQSMELGIIDRGNTLIPTDFQAPPQGIYMTFVVEDVERAFEIAKQENVEIVEEPKDTFYGQRRLLLKDPDGMLVDISSLIPDFGVK